MSFFLDRNNRNFSASLGVEDQRSGEQVPQLELRNKSSSLIQFYPNCCKCYDKENARRPNNTDSIPEQLIHFFQCPPKGPLPRMVSFLVTLLVTWLIIYFLFGKWAGLNSPIFSIVILEILGLFAGMGMRLLGFPALLAPLTIGIIIRNVDTLDKHIFKTFAYPFLNFEDCKKFLYLDQDVSDDNATLISCCSKLQLQATANWINPIREIALTLILTRAGLELSPKQLKKLKCVVPMLAFGPCIMEALTCALLFYAFFYELEPSVWMCLVAGFALSAVSPAVVVPGAVSLKKRGFGNAKGVPTLLIASSSIDDVLAITMYTIFLSIALSTGVTKTKELNCRSPIISSHGIEASFIGGIIASIGAVPLGIGHGVVVGCFLHFIPSRQSASKGLQRLTLLLVLNIATMLSYEKTNILNGAGSIGVLLTSFIASYGWRSQAHWKKSFHLVEQTFGHIWTIFVPILFGTIGKEIRFTAEGNNDPYIVHTYKTKNDIYLETKYWNTFSPNILARILSIILICITVRSTVTFFISAAANLNMKERLFVAVAWLPKATVQAALAPIVLSQVLEKAHNVPMMAVAKLIVSMAVLGIIISAPLGAIAISFSGPRLLSSDDLDEFPDDDELEFKGDDKSDQVNVDGITLDQIIALSRMASIHSPRSENFNDENDGMMDEPKLLRFQLDASEAENLVLEKPPLL